MLLAFVGVCVLCGIVWVALYTAIRDGVTAPSSVTVSARAEKGDGGDPEAWNAAGQEAGGRIPSALDDPLGARPDPFATHWGEGIHGEDEFSFPSTYGFEFLNVWWHDAGDVYLTVLAGSVIESTEAVVQVLHNDPITLRTTLLPPVHPDLPGPVRIVEADGMTLIIESTQTGERVSFDVRDRTFRPA